jgi:hypothetical protein
MYEEDVNQSVMCHFQFWMWFSAFKIIRAANFLLWRVGLVKFKGEQ